MSLCGAITLYVFAASFETVFNIDLPMVYSVGTVDLKSISRVLDSYPKVNQTVVGNYGFPYYLKLPAQDVKMVVAPGIVNKNNTYLARAAAAHYFMTSDVKNGNIGNLVVYYEKSWRTNNRPDLAKAGDNIFLDTDREWRYFYRIDSVKTLETAQQYISRSSNATQLVLIAVDTTTNKLVVAQATLVNVQSVRL